MRKIELEIVALSQSITQMNSYAVILGEVNGLRRLPIVIGVFEAQAIAVALEKMKPARPLTHDLMKNMMLAFNIDLHEVNICDLQDGVFYSKLVCSNENETLEIDSRTSDALALSVRFGCPIYTTEEILSMANDAIDAPAEKEKESRETANISDEENLSTDDLKHLTVQELNKMLEDVLEKEDYIKAIAIRDELQSREK